MKMEFLKKIKKELIKQRRLNEKQIEKLNNKIKFIDENLIDYKLFEVMKCSVIPYFGLTFLISILIGLIGVSTGTILPFILPVIIISSSLGIGLFVSKKRNIKSGMEDNLNVFSNKVQTEKLEEKIYYQIDLENLNNRNKIIDNVLGSINNRFDNGNAILLQRGEEIDRLEDISKMLEDEYCKIDILTKKEVLSKYFWRLRYKGQKESDLFLGIIYSGIIAMLVFSFPILIIMEEFVYISFFAKLFRFIIPFLLGALGSSVFLIKRNYINQTVFDRINASLKDNAISKKTADSYDKIHVFDYEIEKIIDDISVNEINRIEKQILSKYNQNESIDKKIENINNTYLNNAYGPEFKLCDIYDEKVEQCDSRFVRVRKNRN